VDLERLRAAAVEDANRLVEWQGKTMKRGEMIQAMQREGYSPEKQLKELKKAER
jgi:hypothetical protein